MIYVVRYSLIVLYTVFWGSLACVAAPIDRSGESLVWIALRWVDWILRTCGVEVEAEGLEYIDPNRPAIFMSNHRSVFDIAALIATIPVSWRFIAKRELVWIPFFGWAMAMGGHIIVDRGNRGRAIESLKRGAEKIRAGTNVIVFPEGTRSVTGELGSFKSGGFHLAIQSGVPVIPIGVSGSQLITPKKSLRIESGRICVRFGKPIPTEGLASAGRNQLKAVVRQAILERMHSEVL